MNTPGSLDSPVVNTPGSLSSPVVNTSGSIDSPVMNTPGSQLLGVFGTSIRTGLQKNFMVQIDQGVNTPQCINPWGVLTPWCILHLQVFLKTNLGSTLSDEYTGKSLLPSGESTGESITNTNNFLKIRKNSKSFLGMYNGKGEVV